MLLRSCRLAEPPPLLHTQRPRSQTDRSPDRLSDTAQPTSTPASTVYPSLPLGLSVCLASSHVWIAASLTIQPLIVWHAGSPLWLAKSSLSSNLLAKLHSGWLNNRSLAECLTPYLPNQLPTQLKGSAPRSAPAKPPPCSGTWGMHNTETL